MANIHDLNPYLDASEIKLTRAELEKIKGNEALGSKLQDYAKHQADAQNPTPTPTRTFSPRF